MSASGTKALSPAIKHFAALDGDMACSGRRCRGRCNGSGSSGWNSDTGCGRANSLMGVVETSVARGEATEALLVAELKIGLKSSKSPFVKGTKTKFFRGGGEKAGLFNHRECECDHSDVRNGSGTERSHMLNVGNFRP